MRQHGFIPEELKSVVVVLFLRRVCLCVRGSENEGERER